MTMIWKLLAAGTAVLAATAAQAHPKLLKSMPAAGASIAAPKVIVLVFSEKVVPNFTGVELTMTAMPGTQNHPALKLDGLRTRFAPGGKTLIVTPGNRLAPGGYRIDWHAVAGDTHRITGKFSFTVR